MNKKVRKAIIPAAGLGTRFLPATKAIAKEMLPIVDIPTIQYIIQEAVDSGIEEILIITNSNKHAMENHFDKNYELEERLRGNNVVNLGDVEYAILETSGQVTVIQKPNKRTTTPEDFNIEPEYEGLPYDLVIDGKTLNENLRKIGKNEIWLKKQVEKFNMIPEEALIVTYDGKGQIFCQKKAEK